MNILFLLKSFNVGGVEVVTSVLANKFAREGHSVVLWAFYQQKPSLEDNLLPEVKIIYGDGFKASKWNVESFVRVLKDIEFRVLNQTSVLMNS